MHLPERFIQSNLSCIQGTHLHLISSFFPWNRTLDIGVASCLSFRKASLVTDNHL